MNRASYITEESSGNLVDLQPVCRSLNLDLGSSSVGASGLISQDSFLERNIRAREAETLDLISEEEVTGETSRMDENSFQAKLKILKDKYRRVVQRIKVYSADDVSVADTEQYKAELKDIKDCVLLYTEEVNAVIDCLESAEDERVATLDGLINEVTRLMKNNEKEVKEKITSLITTSSNETVNVDEAKSKIKIEKLQKRIARLKEKAADGEKKASDLAVKSDTTDNEIREFLHKSKKLESLMEEMVKSKDDIDEESMGLDIDDAELEQMKTTVKSSVDMITRAINELETEDKSRGLYSITNKSLVRENVVFPEAFTGELGENVYKFKTKFLQAIQDSQVRDKDKVEVLRKHLTGEAKKLIGSHYVDIEDALKALTSYYGDPLKIWNKCLDKFKKTMKGDFNHIWGRYGEQKRVLAIAIVVEFIRESTELAKSYKELSNEIYNSFTIKLIVDTLPRDYQERLGELIFGKELTVQEKLRDISAFLETKKDAAIGAADEEKARNNSNRQSYQSTKYKKEASEENLDQGGPTKCEFCNGPNCKTEWSGFGCLDLYKLASKDERIEWLKERRLCFKCGLSFKKFHECRWNRRRNAQCTVQNCKSGAATCPRSHKQNLSNELIDWLKNNRVNVKNLAQSIISAYTKGNCLDPTSLPCNGKSCTERDKISVTPLDQISIEEREKLQTGKLSRPMDEKECLDFFKEDMLKNNDNAEVKPIPEGDPMFIMCVFKGKTRSITSFIDHGCNCWVARNGIPENELISCKLSNGPVNMGVASGLTVEATAEWVSLLPLKDGSNQVVRGLTLPEVTVGMPDIQMGKVFNAIKKKHKHTKVIQNLKVPKVVSGKVDMIIGLKYANVYPTLIHQFPNGLAVYESKLMPVTPGATTCLGGPVEALDGLDGIFGGQTLGYLIQFANAMKNYHPRLEFFPDYNNVLQIDSDIPGIEGVLDNDQKSERLDEKLTVLNVVCSDCGFSDVNVNSSTVQNELKKYMQSQEAGLDAKYKCKRCRDCPDCIRGSGYEKMSLRQEAEQELIQQSVQIDLVQQRAVAYLPFTKNPREYLADNYHIAMKRLQNTVRKYGNDARVKNEVIGASEKLRVRGHVKLYDDLTAAQVAKLDSEAGYHIPWDVVWKETSLSTPARTVYDASSKTSTGFSLNDVLATGIPDLARLLDILLQWHIGPVAIVGDVSQFYCSIGLKEESWAYQKLLLREDLNPQGKLIKAVIVSAIFGVCSSGGQSEEAIRKFCEIVKDDFPKVVELLSRSRYVDDILKSLNTEQEALDLMEKTEKLLENIQMKIKGWSISGKNPPAEMSDDRCSINFSGLTWFPALDSYRLNISSLHFGKKSRGKHRSDLDVYDEELHGSIDDFLMDKVLTRRKCTSFMARVYDPFGKIEPVKLRLKNDIRKLIYENPSWDEPLSSAKFARWSENFKIVQDCRDFMYSRCIVPENAISLKARYWILGDAADGGCMLAVYAQFEVPGNKWSGSHLLGKSFLAPEEMTIPKKELSALNMAANIKIVVERALDNYIDKVIVCSDSEISLAWVMYENVKLNIFHRNRVNNIRSKIELDQLHHVLGSENCSDIGTRPDSVSASSVMPGSIWLSGKKWMEKPYEDIVNEGIIKSVHKIKLTNDERKILKEGIIYDQFETDDYNVGLMKINVVDVKKIAEREAYSRCIFPPMKRSFLPTVRITSLVFLAVRKFKEGCIKSKIKLGEADISDLESLKHKTVKFSTFQVMSEVQIDKQEIPLERSLTDLYRISGVQCNVTRNGIVEKVCLRLTAEDLSQGLEYIFKLTTQEVLKFEKKSEIEKIGTLKDEILYCTSRILESQELSTAGWLSDELDIETFTGVKFCVPVISRHSPIGVSIALHMHYNVHKHRGTESTFRMSLQHARILQGKQLFKDIADDCILCSKLRQQYVRKLMGPLSDKQLCISPVFYFCLLDLWGPVTIQCPGYEKRTRSRKQEYQMHLMVVGCVVTGCINVQVIEKRDTGGVLDGLNRFFNETSVPKIMYPDQDEAFMKALSKGEISLLDLQGNLHRERGIMFEYCLPQGHYQHGRIERRIRMLQECLDRSEVRNSRCTALGWQCIAKAIERECNSIPIGFLHHQGTANPLLRVLCPSLLKNGTVTDRAPRHLFSIPNSADDIMSKVVSIYNLWFQLWNTNYVPLCMDRPKWHIDDGDLREGDLVYFKLTDSKLAADWRLGKIEFVTKGRDERIRKVGISYKCDTEGDGYKHSIVERPAQATVKLWNVEDTSLLQEMRIAHDLAKKLLEGNINDVKENDDLDVELSKDVPDANLDKQGHSESCPKTYGLFDVGIDEKFVKDQEDSAKHYRQTMIKFDVNSSDSSRSKSLITEYACSQIGMKTRDILENMTAKEATLLLCGNMQLEVNKDRIDKLDFKSDKLHDDMIYLL